jgi:glutamate/aspartate transport system substrate-binding protein
MLYPATPFRPDLQTLEGQAMNKTLTVTVRAGVLAAAIIMGSAQARAQSGEGELSQTLAQIKRTHAVRLGYRESSPPFSFLDRAGQPIGYSLELCEAIVDEIGIEVDEPNLKVDYVKVTSDTRISAVLKNQIDLECGSTTANAERTKLVAFSPLIYVAGTKLLVARNSGITSVQDMVGRTVVVTRGTTNDQAMHLADQKFTLGLKFLVGDDHEQSYQMLADGNADAFATDDILLYGLLATHKSRDKYQVVGDYLSYDPYGIMFRKDEAQLAGVVERALRRLASNQDLVPLYNKWFLSRLPTGERLNVPVSAELEEAFRILDGSPTGRR